MKKLLLLGVLLAILVWQLEPGLDYNLKNRTLAALKVWNSMNLDFAALRPELSEAAVSSMFPDLELDCGHEASNLGDRSCYTALRTFNGLKGWFVVFFFEDGQLDSVKLDVPPDSHEGLITQIVRQYGKQSGMRKFDDNPALVMWRTANGALLARGLPQEGRTSQFMWISPSRLQQLTGRTRE